MGDIIGALFGTSSTQSQQTQPDAMARALNAIRVQQATNYFSGNDLWQYANTNPEGAYSTTDATQKLLQATAEQGIPSIDYSNLMSLDDYRRSFDPVTANYERSVANLDRQTAEGQSSNSASYNALRSLLDERLSGALGRSYSDYGTSTTAASNAYGRVTGDIQADYNAAIARGDFDLARSLITNEGYANRALDTNEANYTRSLGTNANIFGQNLSLADTATQGGLNTNIANYLRSLGIADTDTLRSLGVQEAARGRALDLGIGTTGNYIDRIATPRINQALTLQGLESGGAVPAAIARATAETAMPFLQSIENGYSSNVANTLNSLMTTKAGLGSQLTGLDAELVQALLASRTQLGGQYAGLQADLGSELMGLQSGVNTQLLGQQGTATEASAAGNRQLGGQLMGLQAQAGNTYQNNVAQLAQALMTNDISLEQAGISAQSTLGQQLIQAQNALRLQQQEGGVSLANTYNPLAAGFAQSLPGTSAQLSMLPGQMQALNANTATALFPLTDFSRQLRESDLMRRQGFATSIYTGIPFSPGSTTSGKSGTGNMFDQLGGTISSGATGGSGGFSTFGTKT